jgi:hypothetical protein
MNDNPELDDDTPAPPPQNIGGGIRARRWIENPDIVELISSVDDHLYLGMPEIIGLAAYLNTQNLGFTVEIKSTPVIKDGQ